MYKPINGWTKETMKQQIRLKNNGKRSVEKLVTRDACMYRTGDNNCCAVGCFIPDDKYHSRYEGVPISSLYHKVKDYLPLEEEPLRILQIVHDDHPENHQDDIRDVLTQWIDENVSDE